MVLRITALSVGRKLLNVNLLRLQGNVMNSFLLLFSLNRKGTLRACMPRAFLSKIIKGQLKYFQYQNAKDAHARMCVGFLPVFPTTFYLMILYYLLNIYMLSTYQQIWAMYKWLKIVL